jgi:hypothetical protein
MEKLVMLVVVCLVTVSVYGATVNDAKVYLPFDGTDTGIGADVWKNQGTAGNGESPFKVGSGGAGTATIAPGEGLKGDAFDQRTLTPSTYNNTYEWGDDTLAVTTPMEAALYNVYSFTVTGWIKNNQPYNSQNRIAVTSAFDLNLRGTYMETKIGSDAPVKSYSATGIAGTNLDFASTEWIFFAVTYDGTVTADNVKLYIGSEADGVSLNAMWSSSNGMLERNAATGSPLAIGNINALSNRPFIGMIDEFRVWSSTHLENNAGSADGVLSIGELEAVRQFDVVPEPATLILLSFGGLMAGIRKRS